MAVTGGVRLKKLIESGKVCDEYLWLDLYNQSVSKLAGTIVARYGQKEMHFISTPPHKIRQSKV